MLLMWLCFCFFFKQKTAYEMRISDWSSDVCSSDLIADGQARTDDLLVQAAAAEIRVRGRAGLVAQDYDQMVDVRPKAGSVFPAVGALAAGPVGIAVGALAQLVLQKPIKRAARSEEHTSELQSLMRISYAVFCLKKKNIYNTIFTLYTL